MDSKITGMRTVGVPVTDQDRALGFYSGDARSRRADGRPDRPARGSLDRGRAEAGELLDWPGMPRMFVIHDPDGNGLEIVEARQLK